MSSSAFGDFGPLTERRKAWAPRTNTATSGYLWKYAQGVGPALYGSGDRR